VAGSLARRVGAGAAGDASTPLEPLAELDPRHDDGLVVGRDELGVAHDLANARARSELHLGRAPLLHGREALALGPSDAQVDVAHAHHLAVGAALAAARLVADTGECATPSWAA
jgi:hypothetical protein